MWRRFSWQWWASLIAILATIVCAISALVNIDPVSKLWTIATLAALSLSLVLNPLWWHLGAPKSSEK